MKGERSYCSPWEEMLCLKPTRSELICGSVLIYWKFFFTFIIIINDNTSYFQTILHLKVFQIIEPPSHRMITAGGAQSAVLLKVGKYHSILPLRWRGM